MFAQFCSQFEFAVVDLVLFSNRVLFVQISTVILVPQKERKQVLDFVVFWCYRLPVWAAQTIVDICFM